MTEMNESHFLISTNMNAAYHDCYEEPKSGSLDRINTAVPMLQAIVANGSLTVEAFRDVLQAICRTHATHCLIFNPKTLDIYAYYRYHFDKVFTFNLAEELSKLAPGEVQFYDLKEMYYSTSTNTSTAQIPLTSTILGLCWLSVMFIRVKRNK